MKTMIVTISALLAACALGVIAAKAHTATVPHEHPHLHTVDGALLGLDVLGIAAIVLLAVTGGCLVLARARRKK